MTQDLPRNAVYVYMGKRPFQTKLSHPDDAGVSTIEAGVIVGFVALVSLAALPQLTYVVFYSSCHAGEWGMNAADTNYNEDRKGQYFRDIKSDDGTRIGAACTDRHNPRPGGPDPTLGTAFGFVGNKSFLNSGDEAHGDHTTGEGPKNGDPFGGR